MKRPSWKTPRWNELEAIGESEYLDNGGAMSIERRDHYYGRAMKALHEAEMSVANLRVIVGVLIVIVLCLSLARNLFPWS